jgi:hypothetical protein
MMAQYSREPKLTRRLQADTRGLLFLRIPRVLAAALGWEKGDEIEIRLTGRGTLELRKVGKG